MAVSGLVVTLAEHEGYADAARARIARDPRVTLGGQFGRRLSLVAQTDGPGADRDLWDDLRAIPGVEHVDVTFVAFDEPESGTGVTSDGER